MRQAIPKTFEGHCFPLLQLNFCQLQPRLLSISVAQGIDRLYVTLKASV